MALSSSSMAREDVIRNFMTKARKTIQCNLCHGLLTNPVSLQGCQHCFCHGCLDMSLKSRSSAVNMSQCPTCETPMKGSCLQTSEKMDKMVKSIIQFVSDFCEESGLDKGTYLGNTKSVTVASTRPFRNRPTTPSLPPPPVVHNTPEPQQKVNQWLENAVDSPSMTESAMEAEEENISSSSTFKTPSNGKATTSSKTSSLGKDSFLELRSSSPPGLRSSGKRGRGGKRGRPPKKNPLPIRSVEKVAPASQPASTPIAKQLFVSQASNDGTSVSPQHPDTNIKSNAKNDGLNESVPNNVELPQDALLKHSGEDIQNKVDQDNTKVPTSSGEGRKSKNNSAVIIQNPSSRVSAKPATPVPISPLEEKKKSEAQMNKTSETAIALNSSANEDEVMTEILPIDPPAIVGTVPDSVVKDILGDNYALPEISLSSPSVDAADDQEMEQEVQPEHSQQRLTFSIPVETQDLMELRGPPVETQDVFNAVFEDEKKKRQANGRNVVSFKLRGSIVPKKSFTKTRNPIIFKLMGRLDSVEKLQLQVRQSQLEERIDSPIPHPRNSFMITEQSPRPTVENKETQTIPQVVLKNSVTQTAPHPVSTSVETQTINPPTQTSVNTQTSSLTHIPESDLEIPASNPILPDSVKVAPLQLGPSEIPNGVSSSTNVVRIESDDSNGVEFFSAQPSSKRARQLSSSSDTEDSQEAKRRRSTPLKVKLSFPTPTKKPDQEEEVTVSHPPPSIPSTPTTRVLESDPEDMLSATPRKQPERKRVSVTVQRKVFVCSSLPRSQLKLVQELAQIVGAEVIPTFSQAVTHVIVGTDEDNVAERTLKFLYGVAAKKWVVNMDWVRKSISEKRAVNEEGFEAMDMDGEPGPKRSRCSGSTSLFDGYEFCCVEPFTDVTVAQLRELLELCGAKTVVSPFALTRSLRCSMIVVQSDTGFDARKADVWADQYKTVTVSREWILDCIAAHTIFPLKEHLIGRKSEALLKTMGVPKSLLE